MSDKSHSDTATTLADDAMYLSEIVDTQNDLASVELDPSLIMKVVAERTQKLTQADGASVQLVEGDDLICHIGTGMLRAQAGMRLAFDSSLVGLAATTGEFQYTSDSEIDPRVDREATRQLGLRSLVAVPLMLNNRAIGVIAVAAERPEAFGDRQIAAIRLMAGLVVASLSHASEFEAKKQILFERTQALSALRETEQRFRNLFEHAADAVFVHDLHGRFLDVNVLACQTLGYSRESLLCMSVKDVEADFDLARVGEHWAALRPGQPVAINGTHRRADGSTFPIEARVMLINHAGQNAVLAIVRDVSERYRITSALRESQERFRTAFDHASIGMALVSLEGRWLQVNSALCRILGYDAHELLVRNFQSMTFAQDLDADLAQVKKLIAGEIPNYEMVKRYVHRHGHLVWVLLSVSLVKDETGKPAHFISQIQDITQRREAEAALRASEDEYRAIFELAGVGKAQADLKSGRLVRVNRKFCEMTGYSSEELLRIGSIGITHPDDVGATQSAVEEMLRGDSEDVNLEKRYIRKDGAVIWGLVNATILKDKAGLPAGAVSIIQDVTARKRSEWLEQDRRRVLEMVALGLPLQDVLDELAKAVERQIDGSMAVVLSLQGGAISIHGPNLPSDWRDAMQSQGLRLATMLSGTIWDSGSGCSTTFIDSDDIWKQLLKPLPTPHGFTVCWTMAIRSTDGTTLGLLNVFNRHAQHPAPDDLQTMDMCAKLATICIDHHGATGQLSYLVKHDRLTGLPNRLMFEDRVQQALALAARSGRQLALMMLDIDKFKKVNDSLGHQAGDQLLQQFSNRLAGQLRESDTMARMGGDEFVVLIPELASADGASAVAQKMMDALAMPFQLGEHSMHATTSIGIAIYPRDGADAAELIKKADAALYRVKERGRNGFSM